MTEQQIQTKLIKELEGKGYYVIKLISTNKNGIPDLIAIPRDSSVEFYEVKKPKGKVSKLQEYRLKELAAHGIKVEIYKGIESNDTAQAHQDGGPVSNS
jgi:Holliday junction resolvase